MSCTILRFVVQAFCINLGTLFLSEIILFPTWIKFSDFHKLHWLILSSIFILLLFFFFFFFAVYVSFCGEIFYPPTFCAFLSIILVLFTWLFFSLCIENRCELCPTIFLISMFPHNTCLHSGCRISVLQGFNRSQSDEKVQGHLCYCKAPDRPLGTYAMLRTRNPLARMPIVLPLPDVGLWIRTSIQLKYL